MRERDTKDEKGSDSFLNGKENYFNTSYGTPENILQQLRCRLKSCFIYFKALQMHSKTTHQSAMTENMKMYKNKLSFNFS